MNLPSYSELPVRPDLPPRSAWALWGDDDQLGTLNLLTAERASRAARLARTGRTFALNWPMKQPYPALYGRKELQHDIHVMRPGILDDSLGNFFPQSSSQWDALCHVAHPKYGFWNGATMDRVNGGAGSRNGIEHYAEKGIVGRGVLLDVARHWAATGRSLDCATATEISVDDLEEVRQAQGVDFEVGDILLLRTGWIDWYQQAPQDVRTSASRDGSRFLQTPGLAGGEAMAEWLWNHHFAAVAADNPGLEAGPHDFVVDQYLHYRLIPLLGFALGELWDLETLAADCAADGVYDFLLTAAPLNISGGVGSPANALAVK